MSEMCVQSSAVVFPTATLATSAQHTVVLHLMLVLSPATMLTFWMVCLCLPQHTTVFTNGFDTDKDVVRILSVCLSVKS